jgi:hypothetical protein
VFGIRALEQSFGIIRLAVWNMAGRSAVLSACGGGFNYRVVFEASFCDFREGDEK